MRLPIGLGAGVALVVVAAPAIAAEAQSFGVWRNPRDTVHVEVTPCGEGCAGGTVIWANDKAKADARRGGTEQLIGLVLFRDFRQGRDGQWRGRVFVPDLNRTFSGRATVIDGGRVIRARGCVAAGVGCRSQDWVRIRAAN